MKEIKHINIDKVTTLDLEKMKPEYGINHSKQWWKKEIARDCKNQSFRCLELLFEEIKCLRRWAKNSDDKLNKLILGKKRWKHWDSVWSPEECEKMYQANIKLAKKQDSLSKL